MRNFGFVLLVGALILGGFVAWGLHNISSARAASRGPLSQTTLVVAARPIGFGEPLTPEVLRAQAWPLAAQPAGAFHTVAEATAGPRRVALGPIAANEPVLAGRISGPGGRATLSGVIRAGMRASTIRVNDVFGVAGFVLPGDFVDVLVTRTEARAGGASAGDMRTDLLLQSVRVLAVDQLANENKNDPVVAKAATIEVTPEQAQKVALAAQVGTLSLALRGAVDPLAAQPPGSARTVRTPDLRLEPVALPAPPRARAAPRRVRALPDAPPTIEIFRGAQSTKVVAPRERTLG